MTRTRISILAGAALVVAVAAFGVQLRHTARARASTEDARRLLTASLEDAPAVRDLRATDARTLCDAALAEAPSAEAEGFGALARAIEAVQLGELDRARQAADRASGLLAEVALVSVVQAQIAREAGDKSAARAAIGRALSLAPQDARGLLLASDLAREAGSGDEALDYAQRGLHSEPRAAVLYERRALAQELLGRLDLARADLERASRLNRRDASVQLHLGRVLHASGDVRAAVLAFRAAAEIDPSRADAWIGSGLCRIQLGDPIGARADLEEALARDATRSAPQLALGDLELSSGNLQGALARYRRALELDKRDAAGWVKLGNMLVRVHEPEQAELAFRTAIELDAGLAQAHNGLGAALLARGQLAAAEIALGNAVNLAPTDPNPWRMLALLRAKSGDGAGAESARHEAELRSDTLVAAAQLR